MASGLKNRRGCRASHGLLSFFHLKYVLRHAGGFVPPCWHGEADIYDVCVVKTVAVVCQMAKELSRGHLVVVGDGVLKLNDPCLLHECEDESA